MSEKESTPHRMSKEELKEAMNEGLDPRGVPVRSRGGGGFSAPQWLISLVIAGLVTYVGVGYLAVGKANYAADMAGMNASVKSVQDSVAKNVNAINDITKNLSTQIMGPVNNAISQATNQLNSQVSTLNSQVQAQNSKITEVAGQSQGAVAATNAVANNIASLNKTLNDLNAQVATDKAADKAKFDDYEKRIKALENRSTTSTTSSGGTPTASGISSSLNNVTASIATYTAYTYGWGQQGAALSLSTSNQTNSPGMVSGTTSFQLIIDNQTGRIINNIQLSIGIVFMNNAGGFQDLIQSPSAPTITMSSMGNPIWYSQALDSHTWVFTTGGANTALGNIWNFSQGPGQQTYYVTMYANMYGVPTTYVLYPVLKIASYN